MAAEQRQHARADALLRYPVAHALGDLGKSAAVAARLHDEHRLFHRTTFLTPCHNPSSDPESVKWVGSVGLKRTHRRLAPRTED